MPTANMSTSGRLSPPPCRYRPFLLLLGLHQIVRGLGGVSGALVGYLGLYYVCSGNKLQFTTATSGLGGLIGFIFALLAWPLAKPLTQRLGKRWGLMLSFGVLFLAALLGPWILWPGYIYLIVLVGIVFTFPAMIQDLFIKSLMPEYLRHRRTDFGQKTARRSLCLDADFRE